MFSTIRITNEWANIPWYCVWSIFGLLSGTKAGRQNDMPKNRFGKSSRFGFLVSLYSFSWDEMKWNMLRMSPRKLKSSMPDKRTQWSLFYLFFAHNAFILLHKPLQLIPWIQWILVCSFIFFLLRCHRSHSPHPKSKHLLRGLTIFKINNVHVHVHSIFEKCVGLFVSEVSDVHF